MPLVEITQLETALNVKKAQIGELVKHGMPKEARGKYDLGRCMLWYIRYLQAIVKRRSQSTIEPAEGKTEREERLALLSAERELKQLELAKERGEFAAVADFERKLNSIVVTTKARLLALPSRIAAQLVGEDQLTIEARIDKEMKDALLTLTNNSNGNGTGHAPRNTSERAS